MTACYTRIYYFNIDIPKNKDSRTSVSPRNSQRDCNKCLLDVCVEAWKSPSDVTY
jgi:hypothetical protein